MYILLSFNLAIKYSSFKVSCIFSYPSKATSLLSCKSDERNFQMKGLTPPNDSLNTLRKVFYLPTRTSLLQRKAVASSVII